ncbi:hypothetical protein Vretimale_6221, partial [Volvox reticuliferus]
MHLHLSSIIHLLLSPITSPHIIPFDLQAPKLNSSFSSTLQTLSLRPGDHYLQIIEDSFPKHKASVCLPPAASDGVCDSLAPPDIFNSTKPALYTAIGPVRHSESTRDWNTHMSGVSGRLINYVSYHVAMGVTGLLQYTDVLMRSYLMQNPRIVELVRQGHLRLVKWDMPERAHDNTDGAGRPLGWVTEVRLGDGLESNGLLRVFLKACYCWPGRLIV